MRVAVLADTSTCVMHLRDPFTTTKQETCEAAEVAKADQGTLRNDNNTHSKNVMIRRGRNGIEKLKSLRNSTATVKIS